MTHGSRSITMHHPTATRRRVLNLPESREPSHSRAAPVTGAQEQATEAETTPQEPAMNAAQQTDVDRIAADPTAIPDPIDRSEPKTVSVEMTAKEQVAEIEPGVTYTFRTFGDQNPGPKRRVRRGDTVELTSRTRRGTRCRTTSTSTPSAAPVAVRRRR